MAIKSSGKVKREAPVQFRMEGDLGRLVAGFADQHRLGVNEAAKSLIALAVIALDSRYYALLRQLADALAGSTPFVAACMHVHAALEGAAAATNRSFIPDVERPAFVKKIVEGVLHGRGLQLRTEGLGYFDAVGGLEEQSDTPKIDRSTRKKRTVRKIEIEE